MKVYRRLIYLLILSSFLMITACGGGGGGSSAGTGELAIDITDAKPLLPEGATEATNLWVTISEVLAHGKGGWESLPLPQNPYTIDLLQFWGGNTTELVPPVMLESGKYTQIRLVLAEDGAWIRFDNNDLKKYPVVIPSENLKTDKNIIFNVPNGGSVDLVIDFDLSQSLVVTDDGSGTLSYKCKPVLHIVNTLEAATIYGEISSGSFVDDNIAKVTVFYNSDPTSPTGVYEEYTVLQVVSESESEPTEFIISWLVPNEGFDPPRGDYKVEIDYESDGITDDESGPIYLVEGEYYDLGTLPVATP